MQIHTTLSRYKSDVNNFIEKPIDTIRLIQASALKEMQLGTDVHIRLCHLKAKLHTSDLLFSNLQFI